MGTVPFSSEREGNPSVVDAVEQPPQRPDEQLVREVAAVPVQATLLREALIDWAVTHDLPHDLIVDVELAVYEALANAVTHAYPDGTDGTMTLTTRLTPATLTVTVADSGAWRDGNSSPYGGRGLTLIRALAHEATVSTAPTGTTITMTWSRQA
ncbi:ATP-binding protein [Amycolatopsis thermoflava]|uniref:ATP-binding protein n=1 Tax=Amycolatopsis thermoflava TaxID=84480 RepID=UPI0036651FB4